MTHHAALLAMKAKQLTIVQLLVPRPCKTGWNVTKLVALSVSVMIDLWQETFMHATARY